MKTCRICKGPLPPRARTLCSAECRREERRESVRKAIAKREADTGLSWHAHYREQRNAYNRRYAAEHGTVRARCPALFERYDAERRAAEAGAAVGPPFTSRDVYARDGFVCHLCGDPIPVVLRFPHPLSASVDHVVPLKRGGDHSLANVRPAHLGCNSAKGARI